MQGLRRDASLSPAVRDRVEMILLSDAGWSPPRIAEHLTNHAKTMRLVLRRFHDRGVPTLHVRPPGPAPDTARREQMTTALDQVLSLERTWTTAQLAEALARVGIYLSTRRTRKYLGRMGARWRRTTRSLRHKQDQVRAERARTQLATLKERPTAVHRS